MLGSQTWRRLEKHTELDWLTDSPTDQLFFVSSGMNAIEFFDSDIVELPKVQTDESPYFPEYLSHVFVAYLRQMKQIDGTDHLSKAISASADLVEKLCRDLLIVINRYYQGFPHQAYDALEHTLGERKDYIDQLMTPSDISRETQYLYRIRIGDRRVYEKKELFHLPFELRHKAAGYRYSIPGLPSLYLGGSAYVCWEELARPDFGSILIARFRPAPGEGIRVLDFGYRPALLAALIDKQAKRIEEASSISNFVVAEAAMWPLVAACSIKVKIPEAPFKPEYIMPQLVLEWLRKNSASDGIRYFSNRILSYPGVIHPVSNFVFPTWLQKQKGFCDNLASKFSLTEPASWEMVAKSGMAVLHTPSMNFKLEVVKGKSVPYLETEFGVVEAKINTFDCAPLE